jgi:arabinogalactan endo-1,4-beta-galactosidase
MPIPLFTPMRRFAFVHARVLLTFVLGLAGFAVSGVCGEPTILAGADVSALATMESHGAVYRSKGKKADALTILRSEGINCFRLRLFVSPNGQDVVTNSLEYTLALAKRVKASGAAFMLDLHYSDTWADPAKQFKPAAWEKLSYEELKAQVRTYTRDVLKRFVAEGVKPDYVQLGNEITNGMLWPEGRVEFGKADDHAAWERLDGLLRAAHEGLAEAFPDGSRPVSVLHIESPGQQERALWFCREAVAAGVPFDWIGMSYYPDWHGTVAQLSATLAALAKEFKKPVVVVETAYPWTNDEHWNKRSNMSWPLTPAGQQQFMKEVFAASRSVPDGLGRGVLYWYPESVLVSDLRVWVGGSCSLFDRKGAVLPAASFSR